MSATFDPATAGLINKPGSASVHGRTHHAGTFTGSGANVQLIPVTTYSTEYMNHLFEGTKAYYSSRRVNNLHVDFKRFQRRARADGNGEFKFLGVAAGEYFVYSQLVEQRAAVALLERITVTDGQTVQVDVNGT